ncbi:unnamed protein product [Amoebophrya sp. A25]|nr:unnamed protein product [Amoebophrya sp. A25]|eukprot:GSA25T00007852001.1
MTSATVALLVNEAEPGSGGGLVLNSWASLYPRSLILNVTGAAPDAGGTRTRRDHSTSSLGNSVGKLKLSSSLQQSQTSFFSAAPPKIEKDEFGVPRDAEGRIRCCGQGSKKHFYVCETTCKGEPRFGAPGPKSARDNAFRAEQLVTINRPGTLGEMIERAQAAAKIDPKEALAQGDTGDADDGEGGFDAEYETDLKTGERVRKRKPFGKGTRASEDEMIYGPLPPRDPQQMAYVDMHGRVNYPSFELPPKMPFGFKQRPETMKIGHIDAHGPEGKELYFNGRMKILHNRNRPRGPLAPREEKFL